MTKREDDWRESVAIPLTRDRKIPHVESMLGDLAKNLQNPKLKDSVKRNQVQEALGYVLQGRGYERGDLPISEKRVADSALGCAREGDYLAALGDLRELNESLLYRTRKRVGSATLGVLGIFGGLALLSFNITGNAIVDLTTKTTSFL